MLSSKQSHKSPMDMAPEPVGFLNKMRKSLSGKHYNNNRNSGDSSHATQTRSQLITIPQMDPDTAIAYIRDSSFDKTRLGSCTPSMTCSDGHGKRMKSGQTSVTNGSVHMNGRLPNGNMDENANSAAKQDTHSESKRSEVGIFERQGARPKVRKSSKEDETANAFDKSASTEIGKVSPEWMHDTQSTTEPLCVEMAQPHCPVLETNCNSCSISTSSGTIPVGRRANSEIPFHMPSFSPGTVEPKTPFDSVSDAPPHSDQSRAPMTEVPNSRTEIPISIDVTDTQLKSEKNYKEIESKSFSSDPKQSNVERQIPLFQSPCLSPDEKLKQTEPTTQITLPSSQSGAQDEALNTDLKYSRPSGAKQGKLHTHQDPPQASTAGFHQESPTINQSESLSFDEDAVSLAVEDQSEKNCDATDACNKQREIAGNPVGDKNSEAVDVIDKPMQETIMDCVRTVLAESVNKQVIEIKTCTSEASGDVHKHCCTCTCDKSTIKAIMHPDAPRKQCDNSLKSSLTLEGIPQEMHSSSEGSPKPPRTPHIAMLINSNGLFSDGDTKTKSLSEQDLHMMLKFNAFSLHPASPDSQEVTKNNEKESQDVSESFYSETTKAFGATKLSQEAANILEKEPYHGSSDDSQCVRGATGGSDATSTRSKAPVVDRSSKPKELSEAASKDNTSEEPPPLPPRLPAPPPIKKHDPFAAYPIFDDDDDFPTHEFLHEINIDLYADPKTAIKSKSLPRNTAPGQQASPPELRAAKRGKTVNMRNRFSQIFKPGSKKKRHSTHGFPDRPLPDIPFNPRLPKTNEIARENNSSLFGTATGDIVSEQAVKEGLLKESPSKEEVDKAREQFAVSLRRISEYGWYWGPMSWDDAETRLENMPDGSFLVRDSSDDRHLLSLSFRAQGSTHHTRVEHHNGKFSFWSQPCSHGSASIVEFVEEAMRHSRSGRVLYFLRPRMPGYPPAAVQLLYPISRFQKSRSLQHMCRFVIRKHVRLDHIDSLPLPRRLKDYLKEAQYYTQEDILH